MPTYLKAKTCLYLRTKSTAGICDWTTSHPKTAKQRGWKLCSVSKYGGLTIADPNPLQGKVEVARIFVDKISDVYDFTSVSASTQMATSVRLTRHIHPSVLS